MRFNIRDLVEQADDSAVDYPYVDPITGDVRTAACARVYHLNMVLKYTYFDKEAKVNIHYERIRIVLNKDGIVRTWKKLSWPREIENRRSKIGGSTRAGIKNGN